MDNEDICKNCRHSFDVHDFGRRRVHDSCRAKGCKCGKYEPLEGFNVQVDNVDHESEAEYQRILNNRYYA